jgi:hypothetical protein
MSPAAFRATVLRRLGGYLGEVLWQIIPTTSAGAGVVWSPQRRCIMILLDPGRFLNRLLVDLILILP